MSLASEGAVKRPLISIWNKDGVQDGAWTDNRGGISCAVEEACGQLAATENAAGEQGVCALQYCKWKSVKDNELRSEGVETLENASWIWLYQWKSWIPGNFLRSPLQHFYNECEELKV